VSFPVFFLVFFSMCYLGVFFKIKSIEGKITFFYFITFYLFGGFLSLLVISKPQFFIPYSGVVVLNLSLWQNLLYGLIVGCTPLLIIYILEFFIFNECSGGKGVVSTIKNKERFFPYLCLLVFTIGLCVCFVDFNFSKIDFYDYTSWLRYRNSLNHSNLSLFSGKTLLFVSLISMSVYSLFKRKFFEAVISYIFLLVSFSLVEYYVFASKLLIGNFLFSYILFCLIRLGMKKTILLALIFLVLFLFFYFFNMGAFSGAYRVKQVFSPFFNSVCRFTLPIAYFIDFISRNQLDYKFYFDSLVVDRSSYVSPAVEVFKYVFHPALQPKGVHGSVGVGLISHGFLNFGIWFLPKLLFEIAMIGSIYKYFIKPFIPLYLSMSIFSFLIFNVLNYDFVTILINPVSSLLPISVMCLLFGGLKKSKQTLGDLL